MRDLPMSSSHGTNSRIDSNRNGKVVCKICLKVLPERK